MVVVVGCLDCLQKFQIWFIWNGSGGGGEYLSEFPVFRWWSHLHMRLCVFVCISVVEKIGFETTT